MKIELNRIKDIQGYELGAQDGNLGKCRDFLFDDKDWVVRYIVADTRKWLPGRKVIISPISIGAADRSTHTLHIELTKKQIKEAPPLDADAPVSRRYERQFNKYYAWPPYWNGTLTWGPHPYPSLLRRPNQVRDVTEMPDEKSLLRSTQEVSGYTIQATDSNIGHVDDFIVEERTWIIRYLVLDTSNWIPGSKRVIVSPTWVDMVDWGRSSVVMKISSEQIKNSPEYDQSVQLTREYEKTIFDYYGFPYYW